ncbi:hypothetical protein K470DRAFT_259273 [Piedraia hortae CBS 480.64]|uniref:Zn(2)-C6 fungal-type domain-containing protein n=1 Tax=Piedraia hortae CBS 480.64 TaxID=1314780 RepID=A0A6A7BWW0_9PEZI|nr:hypothetical protein K470DRAFT_259273 [Piedraia hortae CBS 480.64]
MAPTKRPAPESADQGGGSWKRQSTTTRTGQACDRCKARKIRCDARPGGCSQCMHSNTECKTTDRITGRATSRGYAETLEHEIASLKLYTIELQAQIKQHGLEPVPPIQTQPPYPAQVPYGAWNGAHGNGYGQAAQRDRNPSTGSLLPEFRAGCVGDNYLGVVSGSDGLSSVEGMALSLFGAKIDLAEFMPPEPNPDATAMSYQTFLQHAFGGPRHTLEPKLPQTYEGYKTFAEWYFRSVQNFIPIVHKPDFMNLIYRIYHGGAPPTTAETVILHMILAIMNWQWSTRNGNEQTRSACFEHYHYALTFVPELLASHKLEDIQALVLICSQLRNQPRPGAAWMFTNMVLGIAIESGLHRSAKSWPSAADWDPHTIEMRKRIFWSLLLFHVCISGKLGRPMPLRPEDFDIEIPDPVEDALPNERNLTKWRKCSFRAAIHGFKLLKITMQVYSTIYSIHSSTGSHEVNVRQLEKDLQTFQLQVPPELSGGPQTRDEDQVSALYLQFTTAECELLLHHPSSCPSTSLQTMNDNLDICLSASNKLLQAAIRLSNLKSLDTTWYYATTPLAAVFTTLFAYTEKRDLISSADIQRLRADMDTWLEVINDVSKMIGTIPRLHDAVRCIIDSSLDNISRHVTAKTASAAIAAGSPNGSNEPGPNQGYEANNDYYSAKAGSNGARPYNGRGTSTEEGPYPSPSANQHAYGDNPNHPFTMPTYAPAPYNQKVSLEAQFNAPLAPTGPGHSPPSMYYPPHASPHQAATGAPVYQYSATGSAWRNFADHVMTNINQPGDVDPQFHSHPHGHGMIEIPPKGEMHPHGTGAQFAVMRGRQGSQAKEDGSRR